MRYWKVWLSFLVGAVALYFTLRNIDVPVLENAIVQARWQWFAPAGILLLITLLVRAWRWSILMAGTPFWLTFHANNIGYMLNMTLPLRMGEVGRVYVIHERTPVTVTGALSAIVVERILDLATVLLLFAIFAQVVPISAQFSNAASIATVFVVAAVAISFVSVWKSSAVERLIERLGQRYARLPVAFVLIRFKEITSSFALMRTPTVLLSTIALTFVAWGITLATQYLLFSAFLPPRFDQSSFSLIMGNLAGALPAPPGGIGPVQWAATNSLVVPFQIDENTAIAFVFLSTFYQQILLILSGLLGLWCLRLTFGRLGGKS